MTYSISNAAAIAACDAVVDLVDVGAGSNGTLRIYDGTEPTNVDTALSGNTVLAELAMSATAFGAAADGAPGGIATANSISDDTSANATGTATFFRIFDKDDTAVIQGAVGTELTLNSTAIQSGATVSISALTFNFPEH